MKKEKNLDDLFREKLLNYEQEPPAYLLENIFDGVAQNRRKKRLIWWRVAGIAAALLLAFVTGWQLNNSRSPKTAVTASVTQSVGGKHIASESKNTENKTSNQSEKSLLSFAYDVQTSGDKSVVKKHQTYETVETINENSKVERADNNFSILKPIKGLLLKSEKSVVLQQKKRLAQAEQSTEKSIDQQIMEMNSRILMAENSKDKKASWLVGAQVSPEYNGSQSSHTRAYANNMLKTKATAIDLSGGVSVEYKKGKRWSLQSGIYYSGIGQTSGNSSQAYNNVVANDGASYLNNATVNVDAGANRYSLNSNAGVVELTRIPAGMVLGTSLDDKSYLSNTVVVSQSTFVQDFDYLEIPLYLRYNLVDSKVGIAMVGGLSSNILVGNRLYVDGTSGRSLVGRTKDLETFNYSGTLGLGFRYGLTNRLSLNVEPRFKYFLNSLSNNSSVSYKPYTFGVYTGLSYEF